MLANELGMQQLQLQLGSLLCKRPADSCGHHHHQRKRHHLHTRAQQLEAKMAVWRAEEMEWRVQVRQGLMPRHR